MSHCSGRGETPPAAGRGLCSRDGDERDSELLVLSGLRAPSVDSPGDLERNSSRCPPMVPAGKGRSRGRDDD